MGVRAPNFQPEKSKRSGEQLSEFHIVLSEICPNETDSCPTEGAAALTPCHPLFYAYDQQQRRVNFGQTMRILINMVALLHA